MKSIIQAALQLLQKANYTAFFRKIEDITPPSMRSALAQLKELFLSGQMPANFRDLLEVFLMDVEHEKKQLRGHKKSAKPPTSFPEEMMAIDMPEMSAETEISPVSPASPPPPQSPASFTKGVVLHSIPAKMQVQNLHRCIIRVAFSKDLVLKDLPELANNVVIKENIRIAESMEVSFIENRFFEIVAINDVRQLVEQEEATEWNFDVRPLAIGQFQLTFKISVILPNGSKQVVLTEGVEVGTEMVSGAMEFVVANLAPIVDNGPKQKILFVSANPSDQSRLATDKEFQLIKAEIERGEFRDKFEILLPQLATTIQELIRALNDRPQIIHFAGHGEKQGLLITNDANKSQLLPIAALKRIFKPLKDITQLVLLNSCYSAKQAQEISKFGMYVAGYNLKIGDEAAISFARGLYNGLGEGKAFESAYNDAMIALLTEKTADNSRGSGSEEAPEVVVEVWKDGKLLDW